MSHGSSSIGSILVGRFDRIETGPVALVHIGGTRPKTVPAMPTPPFGSTDTIGTTDATATSAPGAAVHTLPAQQRVSSQIEFTGNPIFNGEENDADRGALIARATMSGPSKPLVF